MTMQNVREYSNDELWPRAAAGRRREQVLARHAGCHRGQRALSGRSVPAAYAGQRMGYWLHRGVHQSVGRPARARLRPRSWCARAAFKANLPAAKPGKPRAYLAGCGFDAEDAEAEKPFTVLKHADAPVLVEAPARTRSSPKGDRC
ncbi:MAG: hypothetical protein ACLSVD_03805 [Eggerthellaceae bacterium]